MAFIYNSKGEKVQIDIDQEWFSQPCVVFAEGAGVRDCYILNLYKGAVKNNIEGNSKEPELIKQIEFWDNLPNKNKIMYEMWKAGLSRYDIATIEKGYMLDWKD